MDELSLTDMTRLRIALEEMRAGRMPPSVFWHYYGDDALVEQRIHDWDVARSGTKEQTR